MNLKSHIATITTSLLLTGIASSCTSGNSNSTATTDVSDSLDSLFSGLFKENEPGAIVVMTQNDSIIYNRGFGLAELEGQTKITDKTMFNICSVSKQFSAVALLMLAEQGKLSLDDKVADYFPEYKAPIFKEITLGHLLSHTSGIPDIRPRTESEWNKYIQRHPTKFKCVNDFKLFCEEDESCRYMESLDTLVFQPGTAYEYQNPTYQLALPIIEKVTGQKFDDWMAENIFIPAGMINTLFFSPNIQIDNIAHGYIPAGNDTSASQDSIKWSESDYGEANFFGTKADGGIYTTAIDFLKWDKALYSDILMSSDSRTLAHTGKIDTDIADTQYGYGFFIEKRDNRPEKIYHTGDNGGFLIFEGRFPEKNLFYLIFANRPDWEREKTVEKVDSILATKGLI